MTLDHGDKAVKDLKKCVNQANNAFKQCVKMCELNTDDDDDDD